jgi:hypothetical protein
VSNPTWTSRLTLGLAAVVLVALFAGSTFSTGAQEAERNLPSDASVRPEAKLVPHRQWEYKQLPCVPTVPLARDRGELADKLNEDGKRGWELVSLVELQAVTGREWCLLATLKRQVLN